MRSGSLLHASRQESVAAFTLMMPMEPEVMPAASRAFDHFLASGLAGRLVVGGEGCLSVHIGRGVHIDQLHA